MTHTFKATALVLATAIPTFAVAQSDLTRDQYAANIGVDAEKFSLSELVQLDAALKDDNREEANMLLESAGSSLTFYELKAGMTSTDAPEIPENVDATVTDHLESDSGKAQIAKSLGVDAEDFTLNELVALRKEVRDENVEGIKLILQEAGVSMNAESLL